MKNISTQQFQMFVINTLKDIVGRLEEIDTNVVNEDIPGKLKELNNKIDKLSEDIKN